MKHEGVGWNNGSTKEGYWAPRFLRSFSNWELEEVESFLSRLNRRRIFNEKDIVVWVGEKDGRYSVKTLYSKLEPRSNMVFPLRVI